MVRRKKLRLTPLQDLRIAMGIEAKARGLTLKEFNRRLLKRRR